MSKNAPNYSDSDSDSKSQKVHQMQLFPDKHVSQRIGPEYQRSPLGPAPEKKNWWIKQSQWKIEQLNERLSPYNCRGFIIRTATKIWRTWHMALIIQYTIWISCWKTSKTSKGIITTIWNLKCQTKKNPLPKNREIISSTVRSSDCIIQSLQDNPKLCHGESCTQHHPVYQHNHTISGCGKSGTATGKDEDHSDYQTQ